MGRGSEDGGRNLWGGKRANAKMGWKIRALDDHRSGIPACLAPGLGKNGGPRSRTREKQQRENDKCGDSYNAGSSGGRVGQRQCEPSDRDRGLDHPDREEIRHTAEGGAYIVQPGKGGRTTPVPLTGNGCEAGTRYLLEDGGRKARWGGRESRRKKGSGILENNTIRGVYSDWREPLIVWVRGPGAPTGWGSAAG